MKSYKSIESKISQWRNPTEKHNYINQFSSQKWFKTSEVIRKFHTVQNCQCCNSFHLSLARSFPESKQFLNKKKGPLQQVISSTKGLISNKKGLPTDKELKGIGQFIFNEIDKSCKENLGKPFSEILHKTPESNLHIRKSPSQRRKQTKKIQKEFKNSIENNWKKNDTNAHLAQRTSFGNRNQQRLNQSFESYDEAKERTEKTPPNRKRSHICREIEGDLEQLVIDARSWPPGKQVVWSEVAKKYKIKGVKHTASPPNAGQIAKEYLLSKGVDVSQFSPINKGIHVT